jgi:hypothetical protein
MTSSGRSLPARITASVLTELAAAELNDATIENLARWIADRIDESPPDPLPG